MPRIEKKYHYLYKTTNLKNGKFYVGIHSTNDLNDGYLGSGKYLRNSIYKYGEENFKREILEFFESRIKLFEREKNLVNEDLIKDPMCMNLRIGGEGGLAINNDGWLNARKKLVALKKDPNWVAWKHSRLSEVHKDSYKKGRKLIIPNWTGKKHSKETKEILREKGLLNVGEKNSQFGTCWIFNEQLNENKKIKNIELNKWLESGWKKGRKII